MTRRFDVIVIGAGPAGLMAAKTAAEQNLNVALVERRKDITKWTRADCMMFYGLEGDFLGEDIKIEVGKIIFSKNGFEVKYTGGLYPLYHQMALSPSGHYIDLSSNDPIATIFAKEVLVRDLLGEVEKLGITIFTGTLGLRGENTREGGKVLIKSKGQERWLEARKVIAADGVNSRITESVGLNKERPFLGVAKVIQYIMQGVENPYPNSWTHFYGKSISPIAPPHLVQTVCGERLQKLGAIRHVYGSPEEDLKILMEKSHFSSWFKKAKIVHKMGVSVKVFMPLQEPVMGHVLAIGDAAALSEVENQGALMCGYHAGRAVFKEIEGKNGIKEYIDWWQHSFEFLTPKLHRIAQGFHINPHYEEEEIDYLFSLVEGEVLAGTINQYKIPKRMWEAILQHKDRIQKERPELSQKIENIHKMTIQPYGKNNPIR